MGGDVDVDSDFGRGSTFIIKNSTRVYPVKPNQKVSLSSEIHLEDEEIENNQILEESNNQPINGLQDLNEMGSILNHSNIIEPLNSA